MHDGIDIIEKEKGGGNWRCRGSCFRDFRSGFYLYSFVLVKYH